MALASQGGSNASTAHDKKNNIRQGAKPMESKDAGGYVKEGVVSKGNPGNKKLPH